MVALLYFCVFHKKTKKSMKVIRKTRTIFDRLFSTKKNGESVSADRIVEETEPIQNHEVKPYEIRERNALFLYEGNSLAGIAERLLELYENEKIFLNPKLRLSDLSKRLSTNRNYVSRAINSCLQINFSHLSNYYRVREACLVFFNDHDIDLRQWMKLSGFCSKSSFRGCFSFYTGFSPAKWQREVLQRLSRKEDISADDYIRDFRSTLNR